MCRKLDVSPILFYRSTGWCRKRERGELNGFGTKRNSRGFRFVLDRLTAITFLITSGVLPHAWRTLQGLFATLCQSTKTVRDTRRVSFDETFAWRSSQICETRSFGIDRISSLSRISIEFSLHPNKTSPCLSRY